MYYFNNRNDKVIRQVNKKNNNSTQNIKENKIF